MLVQLTSRFFQHFLKSIEPSPFLFAQLETRGLPDESRGYRVARHIGKL